MANKVTIDVEARFVDNITDESKAASKAVEGIGKEADKLNKKKVKPSFDADDNLFLKKIRNMEAKMNKMGHTKTAAVLDLVDKASSKLMSISNTTKKVTSGLENLTKKTWTTMVRAKDMALAPIKAIKNALFSIPTLITTVIGAKVVQETILKPTSLADQYTKAQIGFSTLLGDTRGQAMMDEIDAFAAATPFKTSNVISNVQKMMAYGWDAERVIEDMKTIGDAAASTGRGDEGLASIVYALSEIRTKGKLSTQELNQLASAGIKSKMYLAKGLGYGTDDAGLKKLAADLEDGAIGANQAIELILEGMKEFNGMMDKTANETVGGLKDQLTDLFEINVARKWGQGLQDGLKKALGSVVKLIDGADDALGKIGDTLYELGSEVSNWVASKFENAIKRIEKITNTYEFQKASGKEKISMLWNGVVADPVKDWWKNGGKEKVTETAADVGKTIGKAILEGISVAWNAMPWWGKLLVGGYAAGKVVSGVGNVIGGAQNLLGILGTAGGYTAAGTGGMYMAPGSGLLGGMSKLGYKMLGSAGVGVGGGTAALAGGGFLAMGAGIFKGVKDLFYDSTKAAKEGDAYKMMGQLASGGNTLGLIGIGAGLGTLFGGPIGTAIGGGLGALAGWIGGDALARYIESKKYNNEIMANAAKNKDLTPEQKAQEFERAIWEAQKNLFGDIKLSAAEIATMSQQIVLGDKVEAMEEFAAATKSAESSFTALKDSVASLDRWNWKVGLGLKMDAKEQKSYLESIDAFIQDAEKYVENKHYEFTTSVKLLMDTGKGSVGESIIKDNDEFYADIKKKVAGYSSQLEKLMSTALDNGKLTDMIDIKIDGENFHIDEASAIEKLQEKITNIVNSINKAKEAAQLDLIEIKFKNSHLSKESFDELMAGITEYKKTALANYDEAKVNVLTTLNFKLDNAKTEEAKAKIQDQIDALSAEYGFRLEDIDATINARVTKIAVETFSKDDLLGDDTMGKISKVLSTAIKEGITPAELTGEDVIRILGLDNLDTAVAGAFAQVLNNVQYSGGDLILGFNPVVEEGMDDKIRIVVGKAIPDRVSGKTYIDIYGQQGKISPFTIGPSRLVSLTSSTLYPTINITPQVGTVSKIGFNTQWLQKYRGGIVGGSSAMEAFARGGRPADGMLKGSTRFIRVNEESPEMIIPLSSQRRARAMKLWSKTGSLLGVPGFARGGIVGSNDEGLRFQSYGSGDSVGGGQQVQVEVGGITFEINVNGDNPQTITEAIKAQAEEIAEVVAGVLADALGSQFENTPARGGVA